MTAYEATWSAATRTRARDPTRGGHALWVMQKDGKTQSELSIRSATSDSRVKLSAGTAVPVTQIAPLQVRSVEDGSVLLSSDRSRSG